MIVSTAEHLPLMLLGDIHYVAIDHHVVGVAPHTEVIHQLQVEPPPAQGVHQPVVQAQGETLQQLPKKTIQTHFSTMSIPLTMYSTAPPELT